MEVRILTATSADDFRQEVGAMLDQGQPLLRMTALRALVKHKAKPAWPIVRRLLEKPGFNDLGADERRDVLMALYVLSPEHGEPLLIEVVKKGGVFKSEGREVTRALAAAVLGEHARSRTALAALEDVSGSRWGTAEETREAASGAAAKITARLTQEAAAPPKGSA
jgi:hypothetical protein